MKLHIMLMELNDRCEQYRMKIYGNKTNTMVTGRKAKKMNNVLLRDEALEQVNGFVYLVCIINSDMSCCQEIN